MNTVRNLSDVYHMTSLTPRERRQQRTRDAILNTAIELIRENGAENLSLREIARRIDYSPAGLYEYFGSKDEIITAVGWWGNDQLAAYLRRVDASSSTSAEDYMVEMGLAYVRFACENPALFMVMFNNLPGPKQAPKSETLDNADAFTILYRTVERAIEDKQDVVQDDKVLEVAYSLWAAVHGMAVLQVTYLHDLPLDFTSADQDTLRILIHGLFNG